MKKYILFLLILIFLNLALSFSSSSQVDFKVRVVNSTNASLGEGIPPNQGGSGSDEGPSNGNKEICNPSWNCEFWNECIGFVQIRNCVDTNTCLAPKIEKSLCIPPSEEIEEMLKKRGIFNIPNWILLLIALILIIIVITLLILLIKRRKKKFIKKRIKK